MELMAFWSNEARIRAVLGGASDTFIGLNLQGRVAAVNGGAEKMFAIPASELRGCAVAESRLPKALRTYTSGYSENMIMRDGRLLEGFVLLSKPYPEPQLAQAVRSVLSAATRAAAESSPEPGQRPSSGGQDAAESRLSLLIVEDDEMIRFLMVSLCEEAGYRVREAAKPSQALALLASDTRIDVLVTDFILPEMNGIELIQKALVERPGLAVILASGASFRRDELPDNRITVLAKPFRPEDFQDAIRKSLGSNRRK